MLKESLRILAILLLFVIIISDDFMFYEKLKNQATQFFIAIFVILCIFYDATFGFLMGLVMMLVYYEIYKKLKIRKDEEKNIVTENNNKKTIKTVKLAYITDEHLQSAQDNIFDENNMQKEVKGVENGFNNESMYGAQGLDQQKLNVPGYDATNSLSEF